MLTLLMKFRGHCHRLSLLVKCVRKRYVNLTIFSKNILLDYKSSVPEKSNLSEILSSPVIKNQKVQNVTRIRYRIQLCFQSHYMIFEVIIQKKKRKSKHLVDL